MEKIPLMWIIGEFMAREDHGSQFHHSPCLGGGTAHKALRCSWETERRRLESPDVCPDLDVGNFQHESDSTPEISSFHLKSESEKAGPLCVCGGGDGEGGKLGYLDANPGDTIIFFMTLSISLPLCKQKSLPLKKRSWAKGLEECVYVFLCSLTEVVAVPECHSSITDIWAGGGGCIHYRLGSSGTPPKLESEPALGVRGGNQLLSGDCDICLGVGKLVWSTWAVALSSGNVSVQESFPGPGQPYGPWLPKMSCGMLLGLGAMLSL